jgi:hypothetical protein
MDWSVLLGDSPEELRPEIIKILKSRRRGFDIRGPYLNTLGAPEVLERTSGYYSVTPGAGNWVWITILEQHGGADVGIVDDQIETIAAYRIGDVLWLEEAPGYVFPHIRKSP